jgi:hypothetical protein
MNGQTRRESVRSASIVTASMGAASVLQGWAKTAKAKLDRLMTEDAA